MQRREILRCGLAGMLGLSVTPSLFAGKRRKRLCGVKSLPNAARLFKDRWGKYDLTYYMNGRDSTDMSSEVWDGEFRSAFDSWSEITPFIFEEVNSYVNADIVIDVSRRRRSGFGKSGGILAWAQMPVGRKFDGRLHTAFDLAEQWVLPENADNGIILRSVACHEIGHILGLDHSSDLNALMYPYINDALKPREDDIKSIRALYGLKGK